MRVEEHISLEKDRAACYKLLSECYYLPDAGLLETINNPDKAVCSLCSEMAGIAGPDDIEPLQVDYSRLFVGPYGLLASPYGSMYLENLKLFGDSTVDVSRRYAKEGLSINIKEVPDHIAVELEFMYFLIHKEVEAALKGNSSQAVDYIRKQRDFLEVHLSRWVDDFTARIASNAETVFYKKLAILTKTFVEGDVKKLAELIPCALSA
ncbi:MAG: molecular chaperone TorD family protein [Chloroflexota bacterium]